MFSGCQDQRAVYKNMACASGSAHSCRFYFRHVLRKLVPISRCGNEVLLYMRHCWNIKHVENTHYKRRLQQAVTKIVLKSALYPCQFTRSNPIKLSMHSPPPLWYIFIHQICVVLTDWWMVISSAYFWVDFPTKIRTVITELLCLMIFTVNLCM